jgi:hypothetical protein
MVLGNAHFSPRLTGIWVHRALKKRATAELQRAIGKPDGLVGLEEIRARKKALATLQRASGEVFFFTTECRASVVDSAILSGCIFERDPGSGRSGLCGKPVHLVVGQFLSGTIFKGTSLQQYWGEY